MPMLNEAQIAEIRRLNEARTPGIWKVVEKGNTVKSHAIDGICSGISPKTNNAAFIAACSETVPALLADLDAMQQQITAMQAVVTTADALRRTMWAGGAYALELRAMEKALAVLDGKAPTP